MVFPTKYPLLPANTIYFFLIFFLLLLPCQSLNYLFLDNLNLKNEKSTITQGKFIIDYLSDYFNLFFCLN
jgi:hypothetical protein